MATNHNPSIANPWVGPSSYEDPSKSSVRVKFCGRASETYDLSLLIDENFLVTLYGKSGNGKTSLLQAGVFPALRHDQYLPIMLRLGMLEEGQSFEDAIIEEIERTVAETRGRISTIPVIPEQSDTQSPDYLWNYFARHRFYDRKGQIVFPVVVFDQFEEVLRSRESLRESEVLLAQLNYIIDENHALGDCFVDGAPYTYDFNFRFVISIREDELFRLEDCIDNIFLPALKRCRYRLNALSDSDAREIILIPGREYILPAEQDEVVDRIIDAATNKDDGFISPFMLSLICSELFKKASEADPSAPQITAAMIDQLGQNILRDFYLGIVEALPETERIFLEDNLVDANRMRNSVNVGMMNSGCPSWHTLTEGANRILQETNGKVELVHDQLAVAVFEAREKRKEEQRLHQAELEKEALRCKNRRRMAILSALALAILSVAILFAYQFSRISEGQVALKQAYSDLSEKNSQIQSESDRANMAAAEAELAAEQLKVVIEDLEATNQNLNRTRDILSISNQKADQNLARAIATKSIELTNDGDSYTARLLALEALKKDPYCVEAESALRIADRQENFVIRGDYDFRFASFSPDGKQIVAASSSGPVSIWDAYTGKKITELDDIHGTNYAYFSPNGKDIISSSYIYGNIKKWDSTTNNSKLLFTHKCDNTIDNHSLSISPDQKRIITTNGDSLFVLNSKTGDTIKSLTFKNQKINHASYSPDGKRLALCTRLGYIIILDSETGEVIKQWDTLLGSNYLVLFSPDEKQLLSTSTGNTINIWDAETGEKLKTLTGHKNRINFASYNPTGNLIVSASNDGTVRIWNSETGEEINALKGHSLGVSSAMFSPNGEQIISASVDRTIRVWDIKKDRQIYRNIRRPSSYYRLASISPNGKEIAATDYNQIYFFNIDSKEKIHSLEGQSKGINSISFNPDSKRFVTASIDGTIKIWDTKTNKLLKTIVHPNKVSCAAFSPDGNKIVSCSDSLIFIWDAKTGQEIKRLSGHKKAVINVSFSPDGKHILSSSDDKTLRIWHTETGNVQKIFIGHNSPVSFAAYNSDGKCIISASLDESLKKWDVESGRELYTINNGSRFQKALFSPDDKYILTLSENDCIRIWDSQTGIEIIQLKSESQRWVKNASFTPDGKFIITIDIDGTINIWEWKPLQEIIDETRERFKDRQLSPEEKRMYYIE